MIMHSLLEVAAHVLEPIGLGAGWNDAMPQPRPRWLEHLIGTDAGAFRP